MLRLITTFLQVQEAVEALGGRVTIGDVAARAGVKVTEAEEALNALAADCLGSIQVHAPPCLLSWGWEQASISLSMPNAFCLVNAGVRNGRRALCVPQQLCEHHPAALPLAADRAPGLGRQGCGCLPCPRQLWRSPGGLRGARLDHHLRHHVVLGEQPGQQVRHTGLMSSFSPRAAASRQVARTHEIQGIMAMLGSQQSTAFQVTGPADA